ncbi:MAG: hypothetical protein J1F03_09605 [Oscillospiraceae bacterium]|nr:hypothetical protein [Oscillospiraceae bacterium]
MDAKTTAIVSYIGWIGWLIALLAGEKEDEFAKFHLNQNLIIYLIALIPAVGTIFALVLWIMGLINVFQNEMKPLPLIGEWKILK